MQITKTSTGIFLPLDNNSITEYLWRNPQWIKYQGSGPEELPKIGHSRLFSVAKHLNKPLTLELWQDLLESQWRYLHIFNDQEVYTGIRLGPQIEIYMEDDLVVDFGIWS